MRLSRLACLLLVVLALALKITIPAGWMPDGQKYFALTVCADMDIATVWIDSKGDIHKKDPSKRKSIDHSPCAFPGAVVANDTSVTSDDFALPHVATAVAKFVPAKAVVGRGLAAPPPPAIRPPDLS